MEVDWYGDIILTSEHLHTSDEKLKWWGYGEWVEEADRITFTYRGVTTVLLRGAPHSSFGGAWCCYIFLPKFHPWAHDDESFLGCSSYSGFLFKLSHDDSLMLALSLTEGDDVIPEERFKSRWSLSQKSYERRTYKNVAYCVELCTQIINEAHVAQTKL